MRHRRWLLALIGLGTLVVLGTVVGVPGLVRAEYERVGLRKQADDAEQRWNAEGINSYQIVVRRVDATWQLQWNTIVVRDGQVTESSSRCARTPAGPEMCRVQPFNPGEYTVTGLFVTARDLLAKHPTTTVGVRYNEAYGYPREMFSDRPNVTDDTQMWAVESLTPL
jgi:Family of unknown function (DUF6174)